MRTGNSLVMADEDILIGIEQPRTAEIAALLRERDEYFDALYAREPRVPNPIDVGRPDIVFFTARVSGALAGCGALVEHQGYGELKRFYVRPSFRGHGLGRRLLRAVEAEAVRRQCPTLRLETGTLQPEAIEMYRSGGYVTTLPFGHYTDNPLSIFMQKTLAR
jgi:putative acetyltransferase